MTVGWNGADPTTFHDPATDYELGTRYLVSSDITINNLRVWSTGVSAVLANRRGYIRSAADVILATVVLPDQILTPGWNLFPLAAPINVSIGSTIWATYGTQDDYGARNPAGMPLASSDGLVTANLGGFNNIVGNLPNNTTTATFYGIDIDYQAQVTTAPTVGISTTQLNLDVQATLTIDDDTPGTVTYIIEWGDGQVLGTSSLGPHAHTYATGGLYAVLVTATDDDGNKDAAATAVLLTLPDVGVTTADEAWIAPIFDAIVSDAQASGYFDRVNQHEPKRPPGTGLTAAVWLQSMECIGGASGLSVTSARVEFILRLYSNMLKEPQDEIDLALMRAASDLMRRYHDDFDFAGAIRNVDLLGATGQGLTATAGYLGIASGEYRIIDILIPCIVNDVWQQIP